MGRGRVVASVIVVIAAASVAIVLSMHGTSTESSKTSVKRLTLLQKEVLATRQLAANWVAGDASPSARVACDLATCTAIKNAGFPSGELIVLGTKSPLPLNSDLVVETAYVQGVLGSSFIANNAPDIAAAFGKGAARIEIRLIAQAGAAAYQRALNSEIAASKNLAGTLLALAGNRQITVSPTAHAQMVSGEVDIRALYTLMYLATANPIEVIDFGNVASGARSGIPLRYVDLAENYTAAHMNADAYLAWMRTALKTTPPAPYPPLSAGTAVLPDGTKVFRIDFGAPTPLGPKQ